MSPSIPSYFNIPHYSYPNQVSQISVPGLQHPALIPKGFLEPYHHLLVQRAAPVIFKNILFNYS